jgi:hypothetical protein
MLALGCGAELPPLPRETLVDLEVEPPSALDEVSPVVRLRVKAPAADPATLRLFRDELSAYHVGRLRSGELPGTLLEREVPMLAFSDQEGASVRPLSVLEPGVYSLGSPELGAIGTFQVTFAASPPLYRRLWPPAGTPGSFAAYCGEPGALAELEVALEPEGPSVALVPGLGAERILADRCLSLELSPEVPAGLFLLPAAAGGVALEPEPLFAGMGEEPAPINCAEIEMELGGGCAKVTDSGIELFAGAPLLWIFAAPAPALVETLAGEVARVGGLAPDTEYELRGETVDARGGRRAFGLVVRTTPARPRVVLNEVLADAKGPEPLMEWVEIVNAGSAAANLEGYRLEDSGGSATLPAYELLPGAFALIVKEGFAPDPATDVPPLDETPLLFVPALGKNGLSNSGETLRLYDAAGDLVSLFPARKAPRAGVSVARRTPDAPDQERSFGTHAAPGASPGGPNTLVEEN